MGAGQHTFRSASRNAGIRLPNGDPLPCLVEDAPGDRVQQEPISDAGSDESARSRPEEYREGLRRSEECLLPIRKDSERRGSCGSEEGPGEGDEERSYGCASNDGPDQVGSEAEACKGTGVSTTSGQHASSRATPKTGSLPSPSSTKEAKKKCFLDQFRNCDNTCMAFDDHKADRGVQPCSILRSMGKRSMPIKAPAPPKVNT